MAGEPAGCSAGWRNAKSSVVARPVVARVFLEEAHEELASFNLDAFGESDAVGADLDGDVRREGLVGFAFVGSHAVADGPDVIGRKEADIIEDQPVGPDGDARHFPDAGCEQHGGDTEGQEPMQQQEDQQRVEPGDGEGRASVVLGE